jgi:polysaccharide biosynthesis transport protein
MNPNTGSLAASAAGVPTASFRPEFAAPPPSDPLNVQKWIAVFRRRLKIFLAIFALVIAATLLFTAAQRPVYTATSSVAMNVNPQQIAPTTEKEVTRQQIPLDRDASLVDTQVEVLRSSRLAQWVIARLGLAEDPEFAATRGLLNRLRPDRMASAPGAPQVPEKVLRNVQEKLHVQRVGSTYVIQIGFDSEDPAKAARIANAFADGYLLDQKQTKVSANREVSGWLATRINQLRAQVQTAEAAVAQYRIANNLMTAEGENLTDLEISNYNQQAALARAAAAEAEGRLRAARQQLSRGSSGEALGEALGSAVIQTLRSQRATVSAKLANMQERYGPRHPELIRTQQEVNDLDTQIQSEITRILSSLETNAVAARSRLASIEGSVNNARGALASNNRAGIQLAELERNAAAARALYESFLARYKEVSSQEGIAAADANIVAYATTPTEPSAPDVLTNLLIGLLLATALGLAGVMLAELVDSTLSSPEDVQRRLLMPYLGGVPLLESVMKNGGSPTAHVAAYPLSAFSEAVRALGATIRYSQPTAPKVVLLSSALPNEGKTVTSICLARSMALQGHRVIYLDCDLRRAAGTAAVGVRPSAGLLEVLDGRVELSRVLMKDAETGVDFLPLKASANARDVFGTEAMDRLLDRLRSEYELIVLDTAPVLAVSETRVLARKADAVVLLAAWRQTPQKAIEHALEMLESVGAQVTGVALSMVDLRVQMRTGYGDPAMYYKRYEGYYTTAPEPRPALT